MADRLCELYHRYDWCEYFQLKIEFSGVPGCANDADDNNKYDDYNSSDNDCGNQHCFCIQKNNVKTCMRNKNISLGKATCDLSKAKKTQ